MHFLHIGKTGGTAIKHALKAYPLTSGHVIILHGHRFTLGEVPQGDKVVFCLRDPITRFMSGFYSRQRQGEPRYFVPWRAAERIAFAQFQTPNQLALALSSADDAERLQAEKAMRSIEHVKKRYAEWFESEEYLLSRLPDIFFIGFQETLAEDFETLKSKLGLPSNLKLPTDDITAHRNPEHIDKNLGAQAIKNLNRWYADDFRFFELCQKIRGISSQREISEDNLADVSGLLAVSVFVCESALPIYELIAPALYSASLA